MASNPWNPLRGKNASAEGGGGYNRYAAGSKIYGAGRPFPNVGKAGAAAKSGYSERDARRRAIMRRQGKA